MDFRKHGLRAPWSRYEFEHSRRLVAVSLEPRRRPRQLPSVLRVFRQQKNGYLVMLEVQQRASASIWDFPHAPKLQLHWSQVLCSYEKKRTKKPPKSTDAVTTHKAVWRSQNDISGQDSLRVVLKQLGLQKLFKAPPAAMS